MRRYLPGLCLLTLLIPAGAQDDNTRMERTLKLLEAEQQEAANKLKGRIEEMKVLIADLRRRGEEKKAELLEGAMRIITAKKIDLDPSREHEQLQDLAQVMHRMATLLGEKNTDVAAEVQDLAKKVIVVLDKIVATLLDNDDLASLQDREKQIRDMRDHVRQLAKRQAELKKQTRNSVPRSEAEKAAEAADRELEQLQQKLDNLERAARRELAELEQAREWAASLKELVERQQRVKSETAVRAGKADEITPRMNRAMAELEAVQRAAEKAAADQGDKASVSELAKEVKDLAQRQAALAKEIAKRARLERVAAALRKDHAQNGGAQNPGAQNRQMLEDAAKAADGQLKKALEEAAKQPGDKAAAERAAKAVDAQLKKMPDRPTLARDQQALKREIERAIMKAPEAKTDALKKATAGLTEARKQTGKSSDALDKGTDAEAPSKAAADALAKAQKEFEKAAGQQAADSKQRQQQAAALKRAVERAKELAKELAKLADEKATQNAGLGGLVEQAKRAAERAGKELERAAKADQKGNAQQARDQATAAKERAERALKNLKDGMQARQDLANRQKKIADDAKQMAERGAQSGTKEQRQAASQALAKAAQQARQAAQDLKKGKHAQAGEAQQKALDQLKKLAQQANEGVKQAAERQAAALKRAQDQTKQAADKAGAVSKRLDQATKQARENDSRRRLEAATEATKQAEEALRRSLKRLRDLMPVSAEKERKDAQDKIAAARRNLKGLREAQKNPDNQSRQAMKRVGERQKKLEDEVKTLEERLKKLKERSGAQRMQDAQSAMREAQRRLNQGEPVEAEQAQDRAEKSLKEAEKELAKEERRYRNLRQNELLFKLKEELKNFRRKTQGHRETLQSVDAKVRVAGRVTRFINKKHIKSLRSGIKGLSREVTEKADAIEKERAIVYTYILKGCANDLNEVEGQLAMKEVGLVPQEMLGDVVRRFDMAIKGLERNLRERQDKQQQQQGDKKKGDQQQGEQRPLLVPPDAEVRMVMVLQQALNKEREDFFMSRPEFGKRGATAQEKARLERLYHQQGSLAELFDSVRQALVGANADNPVQFPESEKEEGPK